MLQVGLGYDIEYAYQNMREFEPIQKLLPDWFGCCLINLHPGFWLNPLNKKEVFGTGYKFWRAVNGKYIIEININWDEENTWWAARWVVQWVGRDMKSMYNQ